MKKDGGDAFALLGGFVADITDEDHTYVTFLDKWELDVGGIIDDCIEETLDWYKEEGANILRRLKKCAVFIMSDSKDAIKPIGRNSL